MVLLLENVQDYVKVYCNKIRFLIVNGATKQIDSVGVLFDHKYRRSSLS